MSYNVGDKFVIEIGEVYCGTISGEERYRIKGFNTLFFDNNGVFRLTPLAEELKEDEFKEYCRGWGEAMERAEKMVNNVLRDKGIAVSLKNGECKLLNTTEKPFINPSGARNEDDRATISDEELNGLNRRFSELEQRVDTLVECMHKLIKVYNEALEVGRHE